MPVGFINQPGFPPFKGTQSSSQSLPTSSSLTDPYPLSPQVHLLHQRVSPPNPLSHSFTQPHHRPPHPNLSSQLPHHISIVFTYKYYPSPTTPLPNNALQHACETPWELFHLGFERLHRISGYLGVVRVFKEAREAIQIRDADVIGGRLCGIHPRFKAEKERRRGRGRCGEES